MGMGREFREFVAKGNVIDLAVGVVVGAAFGKIVSSLVADVITPPLGLALGGVDFKALKLQIGGTPEAPVTINYGLFVQALFDYMIIALIIFLIIKAINAMRRREQAAPTVPTTEEVLLAEIRDLLKESRAGAGPRA